MFNQRNETGGRSPTSVDRVLERYKKTFAAIQVTVGFVTLIVLMQTHRLIAALAFFATMQIGAIVGAIWAAGLKRRIERATTLRA